MKVLIVGGTSGIGLALAQHYLQQGDQVAICGRDLQRVQPEFINQYGRLVMMSARKLAVGSSRFIQVNMICIQSDLVRVDCKAVSERVSVGAGAQWRQGMAGVMPRGKAIHRVTPWSQ